jgi:hypothetical protein
LTLRGNWTGTDTATFTMGDFADPQHATAAEVVTALNAQLLRAVANVNAAGNIQLQSNDTGPAAWLEIDLRESWGIQSIGLPSHSIRVRGSWDEAIAWQIPQEVTFPGRHADVHAIVDQAGGLRLFWSMHRQNVWRLVSCRWDDRIWIATAAGVSLQQAGGGWVNFTTGDGLASNDVRAVAADADGSIWAATSAGVSVRRPTGVWNIFTAAPNGLAHNDVRGLALAPDGARWFATAAGVSTLKEDGTWTTFTTSDGLVSNDIQSATVAPDGSVWLATPLGVNVRWPNGMWEKFTDEDGLGDKNVRQVAMAPDGSVWFATLGGVSVRNPAGGWKTFTAADGLASNDVRGVALATAGEVWLATAAGVSSRQADGRWTTFTTADGLVSHDTRSVMLAADGLIWVATSQGISVRQPDKTWTKIDLSGGLPSQDIRSIWGSWSAFRELAAGQGGNREPCVLRDSTDRLWLFWSQRLKAGTGDDIWTLRRRRFDPATLTWEAETQVLAPVGTSSDRQPGGVLLPSGDLRLFFTSNRSGGTDIWSVTVASTGAVSGLGLVIPGPAADSAPAPALVNGAVWLLFRSDRSVSLAQVGNPPSVSGSWSSLRVPDAGTVRRFAGGTSVVLGDLGRIGRRRQWDDLLAYTPVDPGHERQLKNDELYTRGTIGLYVSSTNSGMALSQENVIRLRQLLARFLPINVRAVVILASPGFREVIYSSGADLGESYFDDYPFADYYTGLTDAAAARPDWTQLHANTPGEVSVDPAEPATIRGRTYFPPPQ